MSIAHPATERAGDAFFLAPLSADHLASRLDDASVGETIVYFVGHLAFVRDPENPPFGADAAERASDIADMALAFQETGKVELTQRRVADGCYLYVAKKTKH